MKDAATRGKSRPLAPKRFENGTAGQGKRQAESLPPLLWRRREIMRATFEQGPIRPPNEARSLLLRFTRNCPWNKCSFCPVYKGRSFSRRSLQEIKDDIDAARSILDDFQALCESSGSGDRGTKAAVNRVFTDPRYDSCYRHVVSWHVNGEGTVFIQDANSVMMRTEDLTEALTHLRARVPGIRRVTSYGRSNTLSRKSLEELTAIREAGLDRIHIGLESGSDNVLKLVRKGTTARQHVDAGRKVVEAGMTLSEYIMPGLGGKAWSREHALETARVLDEIDPHFIRLRSLRIPSRTPLYRDKAEGRFHPLSEDEIVREIRLFIASLEKVRSTLTSDHIMNLLEEVEGTFPRDKERMLEVIDEYLNLHPKEKMLYQLGRRGGAVRSVKDLEHLPLRSRLETAVGELQAQTGQDLETIVRELGDQYI